MTSVTSVTSTKFPTFLQETDSDSDPLFVCIDEIKGDVTAAHISKCCASHDSTNDKCNKDLRAMFSLPEPSQTGSLAECFNNNKINPYECCDTLDEPERGACGMAVDAGYDKGVSDADAYLALDESE